MISVFCFFFVRATILMSGLLLGWLAFVMIAGCFKAGLLLLDMLTIFQVG